MKKLVGIYFSGTGNSKHAAEVFCRESDESSKVYSIEDESAIAAIKEAEMVVFAYPVQFSSVPKIVVDYVTEHKELWSNKKVFVIATMGLFSGDGAGILGRLLQKYHAEVIGGLHLKMPDCIGDEKALKRPLEKNKELVKEAELKISQSAKLLKEGHPTQEGLGFLYHMAGLFGQRLYFGHKTKKYFSGLKICPEKCIGCGQCERLCPMNNIKLIDGKAVAGERCTMCYRCVNKCPKQAITLLGKKVFEQCSIEKYL